MIGQGRVALLNTVDLVLLLRRERFPSFFSLSFSVQVLQVSQRDNDDRHNCYGNSKTFHQTPTNQADSVDKARKCEWDAHKEQGEHGLAV